MKNTDIAQRIQDGIDWARERGFSVVPGVWLDVRGRRCCALGAVGLKRYVEKVAPASESLGLEVRFTAADSLGIAEKSIDSFVKAFDGKAAASKKHAMGQLGERFRRECIAFNDGKTTT